MPSLVPSSFARNALYKTLFPRPSSYEWAAYLLKEAGHRENPEWQLYTDEGLPIITERFIFVENRLQQLRASATDRTTFELLGIDPTLDVADDIALGRQLDRDKTVAIVRARLALDGLAQLLFPELGLQGARRRLAKNHPDTEREGRFERRVNASTRVYLHETVTAGQRAIPKHASRPSTLWSEITELPTAAELIAVKGVAAPATEPEMVRLRRELRKGRAEARKDAVTNSLREVALGGVALGSVFVAPAVGLYGLSAAVEVAPVLLQLPAGVVLSTFVAAPVSVGLVALASTFQRVGRHITLTLGTLASHPKEPIRNLDRTLEQRGLDHQGPATPNARTAHEPAHEPAPEPTPEPTPERAAERSQPSLPPTLSPPERGRPERGGPDQPGSGLEL